MSVADDNLKPRTLRSKLTNAFVEALQRKWETCGDEVIEEIRKNNPALLARLVADLCPKEAHVAVETGGAYADCQSTAELAERMLVEIGAAVVTAAMRKRAVKELERHAQAIDAIATGNKPQHQGNGPLDTNERARTAASERRKLLRRSAPASWSMPTD